MMPNGSEPMIDVQENVMDQGGIHTSLYIT